MFGKLLLVYLVVLQLENTENRAMVKFTNLVCTSLNKTLFDFNRCHIKAVQRDVSKLYIRGNLYQTAADNISVNLQVRKRGHGNSLYEYRIDVCIFMSNKRRNPLAQLFYNILNFPVCTNMNHTCPYDGEIIIEGCRLDEGYLSVLPLPMAEYTMYTTWIFQNIPQILVNLSFRLTEN